MEGTVRGGCEGECQLYVGQLLNMKIGDGLLYRLPKGEEDDELDTDELEAGAVRGKRPFQLDVELNEAVHGDCDGNTLKHESPDMRKRGIVRRLAVATVGLRSDRNDGEEDADEAVLEDAIPCDL